MVNVLWASLNLVIAYVLLFQVGAFDLRSVPQAAVFGLAVLVRSVLAARHFGRINGGSDPAGACAK
jgi:hypothetical protein